MVRVAIIGLGAVTRDIHLPAYAHLAGRARVVAGCDIDPEARARARREGRVPEVYADPAEMIERTGPDVVAICTPPACHHEQVLLALARGRHVFCEKPLAEDLAQADEIVRAAEEARRLVVVNNQFPYMRIHRAAREMIGEPEFGRLLYLHAWQTVRPAVGGEPGWRGRLKRRLTFEFGVHVFELIRFFFGENPARLLAHMPRPQAGGADAVSLIALEFADGRAASILLDRLSHAPQRYLEMRLDGERATVHTSLGGEVRFEVGLHTTERRPFVNLNFVKGGKAVWLRNGRSRVLAKEGINPLAAATATHFDNFVTAIERGTTPPGTARDNRQTLALALAAYEAAESGRAVEIARG
jgi:D-apiose dehydrogenase